MPFALTPRLGRIRRNGKSEIAGNNRCGEFAVTGRVVAGNRSASRRRRPLRRYGSARITASEYLRFSQVVVDLFSRELRQLKRALLQKIVAHGLSFGDNLVAALTTRNNKLSVLMLFIPLAFY